MTIGELAKMFAKERKIDVEADRRPDGRLAARHVPVRHELRRGSNTSPNMRSLRAAVLYPGIGMMEFTNISVGRGTDTPFEVMGAPWIRERELADAVNAANPPGVRVVPLRFTPNGQQVRRRGMRRAELRHHRLERVPFVRPGPDDRHALRKLHRDEWEPERWMRLLGNKNVYDRVMAGDDVADILRSIDERLAKFRERRKQFELYK